MRYKHEYFININYIINKYKTKITYMCNLNLIIFSKIVLI